MQKLFYETSISFACLLGMDYDVYIYAVAMKNPQAIHIFS
jgi:hypothetical protein